MYSPESERRNKLRPLPKNTGLRLHSRVFCFAQGRLALSPWNAKKSLPVFLFLSGNLSHAGLTFDFQPGGMNYSFKRARANVIDIPVFVLRRAHAIRLQFSPTCSWEERAWVVNNGIAIICANFLFAFICALLMEFRDVCEPWFLPVQIERTRCENCFLWTAIYCQFSINDSCIAQLVYYSFQ